MTGTSGRAGLWLALPLLLSACEREPDHVPPAEDAIPAPAPAVAAAAPAGVEPAREPALAVEAEGLRLFDPASGSARPLAFGTQMAQVRAALAFRGEPGIGVNSECGAGALDYAAWPDGLTVYAQGGDFVGWALDGRARGALGTASGIGPGSSRAELEDVYSVTVSETTLGTEFAAGELFGVLDGPGPNATTTALWAGTSCNFR